MKIPSLLAIVVLFAFVIPHAHANSVVVGNSFVNVALAVSENEFLAQPFVLTANTFVSTFDVTFISNVPDSTFLIELVDAIGASAQPTDVLAQASFTSAQPFNPPPKLFMVPVNLALKAGTYYIVASTPSGSGGGGWIQGGPPSIGIIPPLLFANVPNNNREFPPGSNWTVLGGATFFHVIGTQVVPEPSTLLLFGTGLLGIADAVRRKLRR